MKILESDGSNGSSARRRRGAARVLFAVALAITVAVLPSTAGALFASATIHKALFHLDEGTGTSAVDAASATNACLGATAGSPCPPAGASSPAWTLDARYGSALLFDGADDTVTFAHSPSLNWASTDDRVVIEAWAKPMGPGTIVSKGGSAGHNYRLGIDALGNLVFSYTDARGKLRQVSSPLGTGQGAPVAFGQWHWVSVKFSHDYDLVELILDGGRNDKAVHVFDRKPGAPNPGTNTSPVSIGSFGGGPPFFDGVIDEVRISVTPDGWLGGYPQVGSDRGVVLSRVEFAPTTGADFIELYRPDFADGAPPVSLSLVLIRDGENNEYFVPSRSAGCVNGDTSCYQVSPGETVRIWLNGDGPALDTASTTFSEWHTSNCHYGACTLGDGGTSDLGTVDHVRVRTSGLPDDPDYPTVLMNADVVIWGGDQTATPWFAPLVTPEGLWPGMNAVVATSATATGIVLTEPGNNLAGPAAWQSTS